MADILGDAGLTLAAISLAVVGVSASHVLFCSILSDGPMGAMKLVPFSAQGGPRSIAISILSRPLCEAIYFCAILNLEIPSCGNSAHV